MDHEFEISSDSLGTLSCNFNTAITRSSIVGGGDVFVSLVSAALLSNLAEELTEELMAEKALLSEKEAFLSKWVDNIDLFIFY